MKRHLCWIVRFKTTWVQALVILVVCTLMAETVTAQDGVDRPVDVETTLLNDKSINLEPVLPADPDSAIDVEKKRKATIGLAAVGAIAILGVSVIAMTMIWARRLRRLARDSGPVQKTAGHDFWFLKPPKPIASETEISTVHRPLLGEQRDDDP